MALLGETVVITRPGESRSIQFITVPSIAAASGFGMFREQLADLPTAWWHSGGSVETEFLEQFDALG